MMQKTQTIEFAVTCTGGKISKMGRISILQPKTHFAGGEIKWYEDRPKAQKVQSP